MSFRDKALLATGAVSVAAFPAASEAAAVHVKQSVKIQASDLVPGPGIEVGFTPWDIDGNGGAPLYLAGYRISASTQVDSTVFLRYQFAGFGIVNIPNPYTVTANGNSVLLSASGSGLARLISSDRVGPTLTGSKYGAPSAAAFFTSAVTFSTSGGATYGGSSQYPAGTLHPGTNKIGFRFLSGGNTHYGYADLKFIRGSDPGIEVTQWWYEDEPDTEIHVTPVPASGVAALTLLGLGAAGLRRMRKRIETEAA